MKMFTFRSGFAGFSLKHPILLKLMPHGSVKKDIKNVIIIIIISKKDFDKLAKLDKRSRLFKERR